MPSLNPSKSLASQLAAFEDPLPVDIDPEAFGNGHDYGGESESEGEESEVENARVGEQMRREHYVDVGSQLIRSGHGTGENVSAKYGTALVYSKSKLRRQDLPILGKEYSGAKVTRNALDDDAIDSDAASSDEDQFDSDLGSDDVEEDEAMSGDESAEDDEDSAEESVSEDGSDAFPESDDSEISSRSDDEDGHNHLAQQQQQRAGITALSDADRATMREMMAVEQKAVAARISQAAEDDIAKGRAVRAQRNAYNTLLHTRIRLQTALVQANSLPHVLQQIDADSTSHKAAIHAAERAALNLLNTISSLRSSATTDKKRSHTEAFSTSTSSSTIYDAIAKKHTSTLPQNRSVLSKWSAKTQASSGRPQQDKFGEATVEPLLSVLDAHLNGLQHEKHIARTHIPRSCAPLQSAAGIGSDPLVYDDADFYATLLQEFIEGKSSNGTAGGGAELNIDISAIRKANKAKSKKDVDSKASKGRKLRYTVHEKLLNFMAPRDIGTWGERQTDELFASLLGRRVKGGLRETEVDGEDENGEDEDDVMGRRKEMEGLRLFRGA